MVINTQNYHQQIPSYFLNKIIPRAYLCTVNKYFLLNGSNAVIHSYTSRFLKR